MRLILCGLLVVACACTLPVLISTPTLPSSQTTLFVEPAETPGNPISGRAFLELCRSTNQWLTVASKTQYIGDTDWALNTLTDAEQISCFAQMRASGLKLELGVAGLKDFCSTADACYYSAKAAYWDRMIRNGAPLGMFVLDEPMTAVVTKIDAIAGGSVDYAIQQTQRWVNLARLDYPGVKIFEDEAYPANSLHDLLRIPVEIPTLDGVNLDWDWRLGVEGASEVAQLVTAVRKAKLVAGVLIWPDIDSAATDVAQIAAMNEYANDLKNAGLHFDLYGWVSWSQGPRRQVPESDPSTFTGGALAALGMLK